MVGKERRGRGREDRCNKGNRKIKRENVGNRKRGIDGRKGRVN